VPSGRSSRIVAAAGLGLLAAGVGGALWILLWAHTRGSVWGFGGLALGALVGVAVRLGSGGNGGRGWQILATTLTYLGIALGYLPPLLESFRKAESPPGLPARVGWGLLSPLLAGLENPLLLVIPSLALVVAWRLNRPGPLPLETAR
jgi:hypothetical protein